MRILFCTFLSICLSAFTTFAAQGDRPVFLRPSSDAPVIGSLPEGAFIMSPAESIELSERQKAEGWEPVLFLDDLNGFARQSDLTKDLFVKPGARIYSTPQADPRHLITIAVEEDSFELGNLSGDWVEVSFRKPVTAYIRSENQKTGSTIGVGTARPENREAAPAEPKPLHTESTREPIRSHTPVSTRKAISEDGMLRAYEGWLSKPRSFFGEPPYPYQIIDASGSRIAYLDLSRLLITTPLEHFLGRKFHFYGRAVPIEGKRDFVIHVERMQQR